MYIRDFLSKLNYSYKNIKFGICIIELMLYLLRGNWNKVLMNFSK